MCLYLKEELFLFYFFMMAGVLSIAVLGASYLLSIQNESTSKLSSYECGFDPFEDSRNLFDVHFYLVAILFLVLDLEVMFLFPWAVSLVFIGFIVFFVMVFFLLVLRVGFFYEWKLGALEWFFHKAADKIKIDASKRFCLLVNCIFFFFYVLL
jgi:NADH-quinone oxidoreductase subunit A